MNCVRAAFIDNGGRGVSLDILLVSCDGLYRCVHFRGCVRNGVDSVF